MYECECPCMHMQFLKKKPMERNKKRGKKETDGVMKLRLLYFFHWSFIFCGNE